MFKMADKKSIGDWSGDATLGGGLHQIGFATWLKRSLCYAPSDGAASVFFFWERQGRCSTNRLKFGGKCSENFRQK